MRSGSGGERGIGGACAEAVTAPGGRNGGLYVLALRFDAPSRVSVGALGDVQLREGTWLYVGSARRGLWQRVARHLRRAKVRRWHVDALTGRRDLRRAFALILPADRSDECALATEVGALAGASPGPRGFGASDCACATHLWRIERAAPDELARRLRRPLTARRSLAALLATGGWRRLHGATGCYRSSGLDPPPDVLAGAVPMHAWRTRAGPVLVAPLVGGALLSRLRAGGSRHTIGEAAAIARLLDRLGVPGAEATLSG